MGMLHNHWSFDQTFSTGIFTNTKMHLVISYDGGMERYYLNGQLVYSWPHPASPLLINPSVLSIGARVVNASANDMREYFSGSVDELIIYKRAI
jgi:allantoicase